MSIIVLVTKGKGDNRPDYATVELFDDVANALGFIREINTVYTKHWIKAEIVSDGETVELDWPEA